ncbi:MAG TPA: long-chain-fatty-acid--CoA ligase [Solirubrobacterales bacterium]|nr:long-chain-fatty-acid--CoA ligase [Solirubrobacterales bacterium]
MSAAGLAGGTQDFPLTLTHLLGRARGINGEAEVITQLDGEGRLERSSLAAVGARAEALAAGLAGLGLAAGDRVGVFAWNNRRHLEAYWGVPCAGLVLHTMNPRLSPEQIAYTVRHSGDRAIIVDAALLGALLPVLELLGEDAPEHLVVFEDEGAAVAAAAAATEAVSLAAALDYETLLKDGAATIAADGYALPDLDERATAALCYTSGTTGDPKGVAYSHRCLALHTILMAGTETYRIGARDRVLAVVPMFHAMGWNLAYLSGMVGADLVLPGRFLQPEPLTRLIEAERITASCGVPTIWMDVLRYADEHGSDLSAFELAICGGTQVPPRLMRDFEARHGVAVVQGWGMTETLPGAALAHDPAVRGAAADADVAAEQEEKRWARREHAGRVSPFYELRIVGDDGAELPRDGESQGEIQVRGPVVAGSYFEAPEASAAAFTADGWLRTGDVGTLDCRGWLRITDRAKDVIKSGGEWISSVDLESALMAHPAVVEAAVIAIPDERWSERPFACVVAAEGTEADELTEFLADRFERWWLPDGFAFIAEIPKTSVGKFDKRALRGAYAERRA